MAKTSLGLPRSLAWAGLGLLAACGEERAGQNVSIALAFPVEESIGVLLIERPGTLGAAANQIQIPARGDLEVMLADVVTLHVTGRGGLDLSSLTALEPRAIDRIFLRGRDVTRDDLAAIGSQTRATRLDFAHSRLRVPDLSALRGFTHLKELNLNYTNIGPAHLASIAGFRNLEELLLVKTRITDADLIALAGLSRLRRLDLSFTSIGVAGLAHLTKMKNLEELHLRGVALDKGELAIFKDFKKLRLLDFGELTPIAPKALGALARRLDGCEVLPPVGPALSHPPLRRPIG